MNEGERTLPLEGDENFGLGLAENADTRIQTSKQAIELIYTMANLRLAEQPGLRLRAERAIGTIVSSLARVVEAIPAEEVGEARIVAFLEGLASMTSTGVELFHKGSTVESLNKGPQRQVIEDEPGLKVGDDLDK